MINFLGTFNFEEPNSTQLDNSPLAKSIFGITGVTRVFYAKDHIFVGKDDSSNWDTLKPQIQQELEAFITSDQPIFLQPPPEDQIKEEEFSVQLGPNNIILDDATIQAGSFNNFRLSEATKDNLRSDGIKNLFPVQIATFDLAYDQKDIIAKDRTGSGKTLAYSLPVIERLRAQGALGPGRRLQTPSMVVMVPTRELAMQVERELQKLKHSPDEYTTLSVFGGTSIINQKDALRHGVDFVVATPGRLWDLIDRMAIDFSATQTVILDETDEMLNIGFQEIIESIIDSISREAGGIGTLQYLLFSATVPDWVTRIAGRFMKKDAEFVDLIQGQEVKTSTTVQHLSLLCQSQREYIANIGDVVSVYCGQYGRAIIFTETKNEANQVMLNADLKIDCQVKN